MFVMGIENPIVIQPFFETYETPVKSGTRWCYTDLDGSKRTIVGFEATRNVDPSDNCEFRSVVIQSHPGLVSLAENFHETNFTVTHPAVSSTRADFTRLQTHFEIENRPGVKVLLALSLNSIGDISIFPYINTSEFENRTPFKEFRSDHWQVDTNRGSLIIPKWTSLIEMGERIPCFSSPDQPWAVNPNFQRRFNTGTREMETIIMPTYSVLGLVPEAFLKRG
ncbi:MAG TPA: hypothetical protein PLS49_08425 [Candidatus Woesebacteria bacterium]|nr:hypothetical protein [Candidatus Woesebacteria bacterium]